MNQQTTTPAPAVEAARDDEHTALVALARAQIRLAPLEALALNLLDPEMYGHAVTAEIRNAARRALGMTTQEPAK